MKSWKLKLEHVLAAAVLALAGLAAMLALPGAAAAVTTPGYPSAGTLPSGVANALSADGSTYVTSSSSSGLRIYRRPAGGWGAALGQPVEIGVPADSVAISNDGSSIVSTSASGWATVYDQPAGGWGSGAPRSQSVSSLSYGSTISGDGDTIAVAHGTSVSIHLRSDSGFSSIKSLPQDYSSELVLSDSGTTLLAYWGGGSGRATVYHPSRAYWWADDRRVSVKELTGPGGRYPQGWLSSAAMSRGGGTILIGVAGAGGGSVLVYQHGSYTPTATLTSTAADRVAVSADGSTIASRGAGGTIELFQRPSTDWGSTSVATATIDGPASTDQGHLLLSGDGETILAGDDASLTVFERDHRGPVASVGISPALPDGQNGWHVRPVTLTPSVADELNGSGLAATRCALDPGFAPQSFDELPSGACPHLGPGGLTVTATGAHAFYVAGRDSFGNDGDVAEVRFNLDSVAPALLLPSSIEVDAPVPGGTNVTYSYRGVDDFAGEVPVACGPGPGAFFPVGVTTVRCNAVDPAGNVGTAAFQVTVRGEPLPPPEPPRVEPPRGETPRDETPRGETPETEPPGTQPPGTGPSDGPPAPHDAGGPADLRPRLTALALRGRTLAVRVSSAATVRAELARCSVRRNGRTQVRSCKTAAVTSAKASAGAAVKLALPARLQPGRYRVTVRASGPGGRSAPLVKTVTLARLEGR